MFINRQARHRAVIQLPALGDVATGSKDSYFSQDSNGVWRGGRTTARSVSMQDSSGLTITDGQWASIESALITCAVIVLIEAARVFCALTVPYPGAFLLTAVAIAAFRGGVPAAAISMGLAICFEWLHFSAPEGFSHYTTGNLIRVTTFTAITPMVAALVVILRRKVARAAGEFAVAAERRRYTHDLLQEQARLQSLIRSLPVGLLIADKARNVVASNPKMSEILRHPPAEFGHSPCERLFYEDRDSFMPADLPLARALAGQDIIAEEILYLRGDGTMIALRMSAAAVRGEAGEIIGAAVMFEDITQERSTRQAAQELAALVSASEDAIYSVSREGIILTWNPGAERLLGYTAAESRYTSIETLLPEGFEPEFRIFLCALRAGKPHRPFCTVVRSKDGSTVAVSIRLSPLYGRNSSEIMGVCVIMRAVEPKRLVAEHAANYAA